MYDEPLRLPSGAPRTRTRPAPEPVQVLCGPVLCRLRVWSEAEWAGSCPGPNGPSIRNTSPASAGLARPRPVPELTLPPHRRARSRRGSTSSPLKFPPP